VAQKLCKAHAMKAYLRSNLASGQRYAVSFFGKILVPRFIFVHFSVESLNPVSYKLTHDLTLYLTLWVEAKLARCW